MHIDDDNDDDDDEVWKESVFLWLKEEVEKFGQLSMTFYKIWLQKKCLKNFYIEFK